MADSNFSVVITDSETSDDTSTDTDESSSENDEPLQSVTPNPILTNSSNIRITRSKRKAISESVATVGIGDNLLSGTSSVVQCPICFNNMAQRKPQSLPCGHLYCHSCLKSCIKLNFLMCSICKKRFKTSEIRDIYL